MDTTNDEAARIREANPDTAGVAAGDEPVETPEGAPEAVVCGAKEVAEHVRAHSRAAELTEPSIFAEEPFSLDEAELAHVMEDLAQDDAYADIVRTADERSGVVYLHSTTFLTVTYARHLMRTRADDPAYLIAQTVRENSEIYPKPTSIEFFEFEPFGLNLEDIRAHVKAILADAAYGDIKSVTVSNEMDYLYSDRFLTENQALAMAQWVEVDMYLNSNQ